MVMSNSSSTTMEFACFACLLAYWKLKIPQFLRALLQDHQKKAQIQGNKSTQHCSSEVSATTRGIVAADGGRRLCWTIVGKQRQQRLSFFFFFFPLAAQSPPWLVCIVPVIFIFIFFWRISEFLAPGFYFSKRAGYHYKQCFLFSVL